MTITLLFFLAKAVVICGTDRLVLGDPLDGSSSSPTSSVAGPSHSRAPYLLLKGNWAGEGGQEGILLPCQAETRFHSPPSLKSPLSTRWQEGRGFSAFRGAASCCLYLREGRERLHQSISLSYSWMLLNLSTSSFSSATRLSRSFTCSHRTQQLSLLSSGMSARLRHSLHPETWTPAFLRGASDWVPTLLLARAFPRVVTMARISPG